MPITWKSLNTRQQDYLTAIYQADQEVEVRERSSSWHRGERARPAEQWRWMPYGSSLPSRLPMPVKKHLGWTEQISEGTGSTLEALEKRGLITMQHLSAEELRRRGILSEWQGVLESDPIPVIQITPAGRKLVRQALDVQMTRRVTGTLQEWHWRALAKAYEAGDRGVPEEGIGYGRIGWNTWVRLRDYTIRGTEHPIIESRNGVRITAWGIGYYERAYSRYQALYPSIEAPAPPTPPDPFEPYSEMCQGHERCQACQGEYLVEIERIYQQTHNWTWRVEEHVRRIEGQVTVKYGTVSQCDCQDGEIEEIDAPFLTLLDRLLMQNWQLSFPHHLWITYLDYLVGGLNPERKLRWYEPEVVKEKVLPLLGETDLEESRNVMRGEVHSVVNERRGCGSIYPTGQQGGWSSRPVALIRAGKNE